MATKKCLMVDDDVLFTDALKSFLEENGWEVSIINDGKGILTTLSTWQPDIVLLDILMKNLNGLDVLKEIQEMRPEWAKTVIMITSVEGDANIAKALEYGSDTYLQKNEVSKEQILATLERKYATLQTEANK